MEPIRLGLPIVCAKKITYCTKSENKNREMVVYNYMFNKNKYSNNIGKHSI